MQFLNPDILNLIQDFAGTTDMWKRRFSEDVLTLVNKHLKIVGVSKGKICSNCYTIGSYYNTCYAGCSICQLRNIQDFVFVSFEEFAKMSIVYMEKFDRVLIKNGPDFFTKTQKNRYERSLLLQDIRGEYYGDQWYSDTSDDDDLASWLIGRLDYFDDSSDSEIDWYDEVEEMEVEEMEVGYM